MVRAFGVRAEKVIYKSFIVPCWFGVPRQRTSLVGRSFQQSLVRVITLCSILSLGLFELVSEC